MSFFEHRGKRVFYTTDGAGKPLLILNGIMMSTKSWTPFVRSLSTANTLFRVDFFDQGQSDRLEGETYTQDVQVDLLVGLLDHLGLEKASFVGISYGGEVAIRLAIAYPDRVDRLVLFNTTAATGPWLRDIGRGWIATGRTRDGAAYYQTTIPVIYSPHYYRSRLEWMKNREKLLVPIFSTPAFLDAMERLTLSAEDYDVKADLGRIRAKTLIVSAEEDYLTPVDRQEELYRLIPGSEWIKIPVAGHASMYERPLLFATLVTGFVNVADTEYQI
ncbi:MAG: alpha/beta fold hydrolase [Candidatus Izemoplasmatales bacterium]